MNIEKARQAREELDRALVAMRAGLPEQALRHIERVMAVSPDRSEARLLQAQAHLATNQPEQALHALDAHDHYHPDLRDAAGLALMRAQALAGAGHSDLAIRLLTQLCERYPDDVRPHRTLAGVALAQGKKELAAAHLQHVIRLEPSDDASRRALAVLLSQKNPQRAVDMLLSDATHRDDVAQRLSAARMLRSAGRLREAMEHMEWILQQVEDDPTIWMEAGQLAADLGNVASAELCFEAGIARNGHGPAITALAQLLMRCGRFDESAQQWWKLAQTEPRDPKGLVGVLTCALADGRLDVAQRVREQLARRSDITDQPRLLAAMWVDAAAGQAMLQSQGATSKSSASEQDDHSPLRELLGQAAHVLDQHAVQFPQRADTHHHRAICHEALGETERAREAAKQALDINPRYTAAKRLARRLNDRRAA